MNDKQPHVDSRNDLSPVAIEQVMRKFDDFQEVLLKVLRAQYAKNLAAKDAEIEELAIQVADLQRQLRDSGRG